MVTYKGKEIMGEVNEMNQPGKYHNPEDQKKLKLSKDKRLPPKKPVSAEEAEEQCCKSEQPLDEGANGAVEAANKNIKKSLRKMIQSSRQWHEKPPFALLGYRKTVRTSVEATPYLLVYGTEAVIPAEVEIPSLRIIVEAEIEDDEWVKARLEKLTMIDEKQMVAVCHGQLYQ
ncbi:uncharacterized protein [Nicotiana tomentosiformis]|uniref:uncharacterized protein n=1 Tax=Nicotiana tomentosiformis TaxID=4098 RepID=UPI00388C9E6F